MGDVSVSLDLDAQQLYNELRQVTGHFAQFASKTTQQGAQASTGFVSSFKAGLGSIGANLLGGLSIIGVAHEIKELTEYGAKIEDLHQRFGVGTEALQKFGNAAEKNGASLESVAKGFRFLEVNQAKALSGNEGMVQAFQDLGISVEDLRSLSPEQIMLKIGSSSLNAADVVKVLGKSALELRPTLAGLADGTIQFGGAIADIDIARLKEANEVFTDIKQQVTILLGTGLTTFFDGVAAAAGGVTGRIEALTIQLAAIAEASEKLSPKEDKGFLAGLNPFGTLARADVGGAIEVLKKARDEGNAAVERGNERAADVIIEKREERQAERGKKRALAHAGLDDESVAGETDDQGRPITTSKAESEAAKLAGSEEKLWQAEHDRYLKSIDYEERIVQLRKDAADALSASTESRDEEDRLEAGLKYYEILKDIDAEEKSHAAEIKRSDTDARRTGKETGRDAKRDLEAEHRALNPTGLSLEEMAKSNIIGNVTGGLNAGATAREAIREGELAKQRQLAGDITGAEDHQNRAEQLKKSLGLDNQIDRDELKKIQVESRDHLKKISEQTADMTANK